MSDTEGGLHIALAVTVLDETGVTVLLVTGLPGADGDCGSAFVAAGDNWRALWPTRSPHTRQPDRPLAPGLPSLGQVLHSAVGVGR